MKAPARSNIASSFTLIKGAMINETYAVFAKWDFGSYHASFRKARRSANPIGF
jgi:hypothetical protein